MAVTTLAALVETPTADDFKARMLDALDALEFPVSSWEIDGVAYQIVQASANTLATTASIQQSIASAGFLDLAAGLKNPDGTEVTAWLDLLAHYLYAVDRVEAGIATGTVTLSARPGQTVPIVVGPGDLTFSNPNGYTYTNQTGGTVPAYAMGSLDVTIAADQPGTTGTCGAGGIRIDQGPSGLSVAQPVALIGTPQETNAALAARCRARLANLSPNGAAAAYAYLSPLATRPDGSSLAVTRIGIAPATGGGVVQLAAATASGPLGGSAAPPASSGDCYDLWLYLMGQCVPDAVALVVSPATDPSPPIDVVATVYTTSQVTSEALEASIAAYLSSLPIGGVRGIGKVPVSAIIDAIHNVSPSIRAVELTTPAADVSLLPTDVPYLATAAFTFVQIA